MGHARTYIAVDMIKKIMQNYFGYDVLYTMNITNIDDKIIKGANEA
jgi:cysteinyl-tRNA synthetase